jgi:hypothetical protein
MGSKGVQRIPTAEGDAFDPNTQEAMSTLPCPGGNDKQPGTVANVWQVGVDMEGRSADGGVECVNSPPSRPVALAQRSLATRSTTASYAPPRSSCTRSSYLATGSSCQCGHVTEWGGWSRPGASARVVAAATAPPCCVGCVLCAALWSVGWRRPCPALPPKASFQRFVSH